jgi:hypothetical protein
VLAVAAASLIGAGTVSARNIVLDWNPSASASVAGYHVYYGTASGSYTAKIEASNATSLTISNLDCGVTYYFAATAYDTNGNESAYSSEISFVPSGTLTLSAGAGNPAVMQFPVEPGYSYEIQATTDLKNWTSLWQSTVAVTNVWMQFTDTNAAAFASRFYRLVWH